MESPEQASPPLLRPLPRRPFQLPSNSSNSSSVAAADSHPPTPRVERSLGVDDTDTKSDISRTRSIINLTSSTLFGIYAPSSFDAQSSTPATPWGTGAETPSRKESVDGFPSSRGGPPRGSDLEARLLRGTARVDTDLKPSLKTGSPVSGGPHHAPKSLASVILRSSIRVVMLFCFGLAYGGIIAHLHDNRNVAPIKVTGLNRASWRYLAFWGVAGVVMGSLLPWVDKIWGSEDGKNSEGSSAETRPRGLNAVEWNDVVRSVGAFVGVAFAIVSALSVFFVAGTALKVIQANNDTSQRKLPWSSPLQLSLTLALANPFLWYLLDRTTAGFTLSTAVGILGTSALLAINPALIPAPTDTYASPANYTAPFALRHIQQARSIPEMQDALGSLLSYERVGVATWIASVLFCSCVCFGNIGRLLVPESRARR
jgi:hypothetical protein